MGFGAFYGTTVTKDLWTKKKATRGWLYKVPEGTSLEPVEGNLLVGFASILVNCDSSWNEFSCGAEQSGIPHSGEFEGDFQKKSKKITQSGSRISKQAPRGL